MAGVADQPAAGRRRSERPDRRRPPARHGRWRSTTPSPLPCCSDRSTSALTWSCTAPPSCCPDTRTWCWARRSPAGRCHRGAGDPPFAARRRRRTVGGLAGAPGPADAVGPPGTGASQRRRAGRRGWATMPPSRPSATPACPIIPDTAWRPGRCAALAPWSRSMSPAAPAPLMPWRGPSGLATAGTSLGGVETLIERRGRWSGEKRLPPGLLALVGGHRGRRGPVARPGWRLAVGSPITLESQPWHSSALEFVLGRVMSTPRVRFGGRREAGDGMGRSGRVWVPASRCGGIGSRGVDTFDRRLAGASPRLAAPAAARRAAGRPPAAPAAAPSPARCRSSRLPPPSRRSAPGRVAAGLTAHLARPAVRSVADATCRLQPATCHLRPATCVCHLRLPPAFRGPPVEMLASGPPESRSFEDVHASRAG